MEQQETKKQQATMNKEQQQQPEEEEEEEEQQQQPQQPEQPEEEEQQQRGLVCWMWSRFCLWLQRMDVVKLVCVFLLPIIWDKRKHDTWPGAGYARFSCNENFSTERERDKIPLKSTNFWGTNKQQATTRRRTNHLFERHGTAWRILCSGRVFGLCQG